MLTKSNKRQPVSTVDRGTPEVRGDEAQSHIRKIPGKGIFNLFKVGRKWFNTPIQENYNVFRVDQLMANLLFAPNDLTIKAGTDNIYFGRIKDAQNIGVSDASLDIWTGDGWRLWFDEWDLSNLEVDNLTVRNEMWVRTFILNEVRAQNGDMIISSSAKVSAVSGSGPYTITFEVDNAVDAQPFAVDDMIVARGMSVDEATTLHNSNMVVTEVYPTTATPDTITATLRGGRTAPAEGFVFVRVGNTSVTARQGSIWATAEGNDDPPYMEVMDGINSWTKWDDPDGQGMVRARFGKLDGITGGTNQYGLWADTLVIAPGSGISGVNGIYYGFGSFARRHFC